MKTFNDLLNDLDACNPAKEWAAGKTWEKVYKTCHRGDWLLWLFKRTNPDDLRIFTLAKARCANTMRHLMKDERSIKALGVANRFGIGDASLEELRNAAAEAFAATLDDPENDGTYAAYAAAAANCTNSPYVARPGKQQRAAAIVRQTIPIESFNINQ